MELSPAELAELQTVFKAECDEHLSALNGLLMSLERRPDDADVLNETFRRVHSVKGAARMVGLQGIEAIAHALETMLAPVRDGKRKLDRRELDLLFEGTDAITVFMSTAAGTSKEDPKVCELLAKMSTNGHSNGAAANAAEPTNGEASQATASTDVPKSTPASAIELAVENVAGGEMVRIPADKIDKLIALRGELVRALTVEEDELK